MEKIGSLLTDPSWWFSAIFVAMIVSIISGFLKDKIGEALSHFSVFWKERRRVQKETREAVIQALMDDDTYRSMISFKLLSGFIMSLTLLIIFVISFLIIKIEFSASSLLALFFIEVVMDFLMLGSGVAALAMMHVSLSRYDVFFEAMSRYRKLKQIPILL